MDVLKDTDTYIKFVDFHWSLSMISLVPKSDAFCGIHPTMKASDSSYSIKTRSLF